jgi:hypothetical protein
MTKIPTPKDTGTKLYLLTIRGQLNPATLEEARQVHNATAGSEPSIAGSTALGDLSHNVYVRADQPPAKGAGEVLFLDVWNSLIGMQQFFEDPGAKAGGAKIFADRDPVVWTHAEGLVRVAAPAPRDKTERVIGLIRGKVKSMKQARETLDAVVGKSLNAARRHGHLSREYYVRADGGDALEILGMDVWTSLAGAGEYYSKVEDMASLGSIFDGMPAASVWRQPEGSWVEW